MKTFGTVMTLCLSLLLVAGLVAGVSAQQQPTAPAPTESKDATKDQSPTMSSPQPTPPASERSMTPGAPAPGQPQQTPSTSTDKQTNTTVTERTTVEREPARIFGMDATLAMVLGAALLVVIVIGLVAMGRRGETVEHHHHRV